MKEQTDIVIVGAGVSGLLAAIAAARCGDHPLVLEKLGQPGKKLLATGNGRCTLMNLNAPVYYGDTEFANVVLGSAPVTELTEFWNSLGLRIRYDAEGRGYPCTFLASTVLEVLKAELRRLSVDIRVNTPVRALRIHGKRFSVTSESGDTFEADRVILATGGAAQPVLGGNTDAFSWLRETGHRVVNPVPSLTPLITDPRSVSGLSGLRVKCGLSVYTDGRELHREQGELLFTEKGISGICVMQCSRFVVPGRSVCGIRLVSDLCSGKDELLQELEARQKKQICDSPPELLRGLCAPKMAFAVCKQAGLPLRGETAGKLTPEQLEKVACALWEYRVRIVEREGFDRAQVMAGGLDCREVRPENMESVRCPGLHVTGELLNVDGDCGGYNLMFAVMSGLKAGRNGRSEIR